MRILFDSKNKKYKSVFGTLRVNEGCTVNIHIPQDCMTVSVKLVFEREDGSGYSTYFLKKNGEYDLYDIYTCTFSFAQTGLYFYYFDIKTEGGEFSLFKSGYDLTNMCEGEKWQVSCIPSDFSVPDEYKGNIMYQIFPDRFNKFGMCDTKGKLEPFFLHSDTNDTPVFLPDEKGIVQNNDFFGGNINGITEKLDYLKSLNVGVLYMNPIFKAYSNHRYDTADFMKIDELLGTENDFVKLCEEAHKRNIRVILDGVFSHTGRNSIYFDGENVFKNGALSNENSPYRDWFDFQNYPYEYTSWWGIKTLPCVKEENESYRDYIINNEDSVIAHWLKLGADGFRLDVADELPDSFILELRTRMKKINKDSFLVGEVWEDASNKCSYGVRREYFTSGELDSVMNYPFRKAIIDFCMGYDMGAGIKNTVMTVAENYPRDVLNCLMNIVSTHDTVRILSELGVTDIPQRKEDRALYRMNEYELEIAKNRLLCAVFLQFVLPGMPCIYYGDEIGTEGFEDPFCRTYFDWSKTENNSILDFYKEISQKKANLIALKLGDIFIDVVADGVIKINRVYKDDSLECFVNVSDNDFTIEQNGKNYLLRNAAVEKDKICLKKFGFILKTD